jgi:hypothetical protein
LQLSNLRECKRFRQPFSTTCVDLLLPSCCRGGSLDSPRSDTFLSEFVLAAHAGHETKAA